MFDPSMLEQYTDSELLGLIQKLDLLCDSMKSGPTSNGRRYQQLAQAELQRRRNLKRRREARVEEVR